MPDLPFQGALRIRSTNMQRPNTDTLTEVTGPPTSENDIYPKAFIKEPLNPEITIEKDTKSSKLHERGDLRERILTRSAYKIHKMKKSQPFLPK